MELLANRRGANSQKGKVFMIESILTIVLAVAIAIERLVEVIKPLYLKVKNYITKRNDSECTKTEKIIISIATGVVLCLIGGIGLDIPAIPIIVSQILCGLAASIGSNAIHAILGLIVAFKDAAEKIKSEQ